MIVIEFILELIVWLLVEIIFDGLMVGTWKLLVKAWNFVKRMFSGLKVKEGKQASVKKA